MRKLLVIAMVLVMCSVAWGFELGELSTDHDVGTYYNDTGAKYRTTYLDNYNYGDFSLTNILRANYDEFVDSEKFSMLKSEVAYNIYKNFSIKYQHEDKDTASDNLKEGRQGFAVKFKNKWKDLFVVNDFTWFPLESQSDHQVRIVTVAKFRCFDLTNFWNIDIDAVGDTEQFMITNLCYWFEENMGLALEIQRQTSHDITLRVGTKVRF